MPEEWSKDRLLEMSRAFQRNRILLTAAELDLFSKLSRKSQTAGELSLHEDWNLRGVTIILDALTAMGLLSRTADGHYSTKEELVGFLAEGSPDSVLPMLLHSVHLWESWSCLTEIVRTGKSPHAVAAAVRSDEEVEAFIGAMQVVARKTAETMAASIDLTGYRRMLDLGGGPGTYTIAFLKKAPRMTTTLFDLPRVIELARKRFTEATLIDRVQLVAGDYDTDPLPDGYDLVWVSAVIHSNGRDRNRDLFKKVFGALTPGGTILIRDYFLDPTRTLPADGAIFAVNMLAATTDGNCYTFEEVKEDLEGAGFGSVQIIVHGTRMDQVVSAVK